MKKLIILFICILFISGCGKPKLANGEEVVGKIDGLEVTANDIYKKLKQTNGTAALIDLIDSYIANKEIKTDQAAKDHVASTIETYKIQFADQDWDELLRESGFKSQKDLEDLILLTYKKEQLANQFVMASLSEDDLKAYYDNDVVGAIDVRHILIRPDETNEDQEAALEEALNKANDLIKELNDGADFIELAKEHSDDTSAEDGGIITNVTKEQFVEEFFNASVALKVNEYTKEPVKTQYGYHIILKLKQDEKKSYEEEKENIKQTLAKKIIDSGEQSQEDIWFEIRKSHNFVIYDNDLKAIYNSNTSQ